MPKQCFGCKYILLFLQIKYFLSCELCILYGEQCISDLLRHIGLILDQNLPQDMVPSYRFFLQVKQTSSNCSAISQVIVFSPITSIQLPRIVYYRSRVQTLAEKRTLPVFPANRYPVKTYVFIGSVLYLPCYHALHS